jgi:predicted ABC-type transport system involved in lysophospholipase L1 biosynthesis ATPase subunit
MQAEARRIRTAVQRQQELRAGTAIRYPRQLRREALGYARRRQQAGDSLKSIGGRLGLRPQLLHYWQKTSNGVMRRVRIASARDARATSLEAGRLVLLTPGGLRVEGLDVAGLAELLRALS